MIKVHIISCGTSQESAPWNDALKRGDSCGTPVKNAQNLSLAWGNTRQLRVILQQERPAIFKTTKDMENRGKPWKSFILEETQEAWTLHYTTGARWTPDQERRVKDQMQYNIINRKGWMMGL